MRTPGIPQTHTHRSYLSLVFSSSLSPLSISPLSLYSISLALHFQFRTVSRLRKFRLRCIFTRRQRARARIAFSPPLVFSSPYFAISRYATLNAIRRENCRALEIAQKGAAVGAVLYISENSKLKRSVQARNRVNISNCARARIDC